MNSQNLGPSLHNPEELFPTKLDDFSNRAQVGDDSSTGKKRMVDKEEETNEETSKNSSIPVPVDKDFDNLEPSTRVLKVNININFKWIFIAVVWA